MTEALKFVDVPWSFIALTLGLGVLIMLGVKARRQRKDGDEDKRYRNHDVLGVF